MFNTTKKISFWWEVFLIGVILNILLTASITIAACTDNDGDGYCRDGGTYIDCDDNDPNIHPFAPEVCNYKDDDCDGIVDEGSPQGCRTYYKDADNDFYGLTDDWLCLCAPSGYYLATVGGDCNDQDPYINPGANEICNHVDDDCNMIVDDNNSCTPMPFIKVTDSVAPSDDKIIDFGYSDIGFTLSETVTIENVGTSDLIIYNIGQSDPLASPFNISNDNCSGKTLTQLENCTIEVGFTPVLIGSFTDSFDIPSNDNYTGTVTINVKGAAPKSYTVNISLRGTGSGNISSTPPGIDCGTNCTATFDVNTEVILTATPNAGSSFVAWQDNCSFCGSSDQCFFSITDNYTCGAIFKLINQPPVINDFTATPQSGVAPLDVSLTCDATDNDGSITEYQFLFGDGDNVTGNTTGTTTHTYQSKGTYTATCIAVDDQGATASTEVTVTVSANTGTQDTGGGGGGCTIFYEAAPEGIDIMPFIVGFVYIAIVLNRRNRRK